MYIGLSDIMLKLKMEPTDSFFCLALSVGNVSTQEFSDIFRRAFASRVFPPDVVEQLGQYIVIYGYYCTIANIMIICTVHYGCLLSYILCIPTYNIRSFLLPTYTLFHVANVQLLKHCLQYVLSSSNALSPIQE